MTEYCKPSDLLTGDLGGLDDEKEKYVVMATEEMESFIGFVYLLPLSGLDFHVTLILKNICRKLASGWLLMAQAVATEDGNVNAYGKYLVDEAYRDLWAIRNGQIELGVPKVADSALTGDAPAILEGDLVSGVDAYYDWLDQPWWIPRAPYRLRPIWRPGPNG